MIPGSRGCDNLPVGRIVVCVVLFCCLIVIIFRFVNFQPMLSLRNEEFFDKICGEQRKRN